MDISTRLKKIKEVPPHYLKSLLLLRNEYLCLLASKSRVEYEEFFKNRLNSSPLKYKLEEHCEKNPLCNRCVLIIEPL